ncbi:uncharacterized protein [Rutidosis leptorrhynchoides]|uniref:uncharacterized protein n=1 Tax=Rutidosis leptorrhynchoides TaxID=125765 RepID=UPI003A9A1E21
MEELFEKSIFGEVAAYTYMIEIQKKGLPHVHILIILKAEFKMYKPEEYDQIVCAEIPNKAHNSHLHNMVIKHMLHGPCGNKNPTNVCMKKDGKCNNSFPKAYSNETIQTTDAYPIYRRRNNKVTVNVRGAKIDNGWVVPYNPYLLVKYDCHINVEICSTIKAVKYIYKHIFKGCDRITFPVLPSKESTMIDEIDQYQSALKMTVIVDKVLCSSPAQSLGKASHDVKEKKRYGKAFSSGLSFRDFAARTAGSVSPPEAAWRIFRFPLSEIKPAVIHLQLHVENYQPLTFKKKDRLHNVLQNPAQRKTMLTEFFYMNKTDPVAQQLKLTYSQFPDHFVWMQDKRYWKYRKLGKSIGRIVLAHPSEGERYYLWILLSKVRCPTSFDDLKMCDGVKAPTFREALMLRGYLADDNSQYLCLQEASVFRMPYELRRLLATILIYSCPNNPQKLWLSFENHFVEDFITCHHMTRRVAITTALRKINGFLQSMGKNIHDFNLIPRDLLYADIEDQTREISAEKSIVVLEKDLDAISSLNEKQRIAFETIINKVNSNESGAFFVDGPGCTGKTYLYRALLAKVRSGGHIALATATSGIAASILPGGRTAHSRFKIPLDLREGTVCRVSKQSSLANLVKECKLIIWDEAPMVKRFAIEALNDLLQDLMDNQALFGGKVVVLGGDFRQTLPVVAKGTKIETLAACLTTSLL